MEQIAAPGGQPRATLDDPLDHLLACHRRIEERLEILERAADHLGDRRDEALEAVNNCFRFLDSNGVWHTADEEESIFPRLRGRVSPEEARLLGNLEAEHRHVEQVYRHVKDRCAALSTVAPSNAGEAIASFRSAVARLCELYRVHIAAEDAGLVSLGRRLLEATQLSDISREMKLRRGLAP